MEHDVAERRTTLLVVGSEALRNQPSSVHRFHIVLAEAFSPIRTDRDEATHEDTGNEPKSHHRSAMIVDEQTHLEKCPVFQHFRVGGSFHVLSEKFGVFEQALWGQPDARFAHAP